MRSITLAVIVILLCLVTVSAQSNQKTAAPKPDFSGTWLLDRDSTNVRPSGANLPIKIIHHDPELRIVRTYENNGQTKSFDYIYFTDGRGEQNQSTSVIVSSADLRSAKVPTNQVNTITKWNGAKIVTRSKLESLIAGRRLSFDVIDEWALSSDGNTLTQRTKTTFDQTQSSGVFMPANNPDIKRVYVRQP